MIETEKVSDMKTNRPREIQPYIRKHSSVFYTSHQEKTCHFSNSCEPLEAIIMTSMREKKERQRNGEREKERTDKQRKCSPKHFITLYISQKEKLGERE